MSNIKNVVTDTDLGETLKTGALENGKLDLNFSADNFKLDPTSGALLLKYQKYLSNATLSGTVLKLAVNDSNEVSIDLAPIIPQVPADMFLSNVSYDAATKSLKFVVANGNPDGSAKEILTPLSDLIPISVGNGLEGDGTSTSPLTTKIATDSVLKVDANGLDVDDTKLITLTNVTGTTVLGKILPA